MRRHILTFDEKLALNDSMAGGKGAGLARLKRFGFPVPPGFVICVPAFQPYLSSLVSEYLNENQPFTQEMLENINTCALDSELPLNLEDSIKKEYLKLGGRVAVRSSLRGEDSSEGSFAGQLDTVLDVEGENDVIHAVKKCLSSCFNWRLWKYIAEKKSIEPGEAHRFLSTAVIIQRMVTSEVSGVAFSEDPVSGKNDIIIEASCGRGDKVVQGRINPDRYVLNDQGKIQEIISIDPNRTELEKPNIEKLANLVIEISSKMGGPQDIEWAYDGKDFFILQSRPITAIQTGKTYSCKLVADMCPGLVKPLLWSTKYRSMIQNVFGRLFKELLGPIELDFARLIIRIHSRVYADMTEFGNLLEQTGLPANFFEIMTREEKGSRPHFTITLKKLPSLIRLFRVSRRYSRVLNEISDFIETQNQKLEYFRRADWSKQSPNALLNNIDSLLVLHSKSQWYIFIGPMNMSIRNKMINRLVKRNAADINPSTIISGLVDLKALEPNTRLLKIAGLAQKLDPDLKTLLEKGSDKEIRDTFVLTRKGQELASQVDDFLQKYGFLSANGSDFSEIPWIENPTIVWRSIGRLASLPAAPVTNNFEQKREEQIKHVRKALKFPRRLLFDRLLESTRKYIRLREHTSFLMSEETYLMRRQFLALAGYLVSERKIEKESDIFYLYYDELGKLAEGELNSKTACRRIAERKREMEEDAQIDLPATISGTHLPGRTPIELDDKDYLSGISVSTGRIQGVARVINDPAQLEGSVNANDILVVPFTDVGWTPLLPGIGGIVAETGGVLSHTAIIAREYGLPAVVSVNRATQIIKDRQPLTVDGDAGKVYLKHILNV